jgi:hypothetical protein
MQRRSNGVQLVDELLRKVKEGVNPWVRSLYVWVAVCLCVWVREESEW